MDQTNKQAQAEASPPLDITPPQTLAEARPVWWRIGLLSFGGPAGQIAVMHRLLVDERRWISEAQFLHALNYCMLLPGPEAQQLATYLGWLMHGVRGGLFAGVVFILPGAVTMVGLSLLYATLGHVGVVAALFFGLKAAVLAIVIQAVLRVGRRALKTRLLQALAAGAFVAIFMVHVPFPLIVLGAGVIGFVLQDREASPSPVPSSAHPPLHQTLQTAALWLSVWLGPVAALVIGLGPAHVFSQIALFFSQMAVVTFGGAYAVLAYVAQQAVETHGWLSAGQMLDGLGLAETTPGPLILVLEFVGTLASFHAPSGLAPWFAGLIGGAIAVWVTFAPCFVWIFVGAPYVEALRGHRSLNAALSAITAAIVGVILNLAVWFSVHTLFAKVVVVDMPLGAWHLGVDIPVWQSLNPLATGLSLLALVLTFGMRTNVFVTLCVCALAGGALFMIGEL